MDLDHIEDPNDYHPGGLHPVHLGDKLNNRYRVAHKLGAGAFGTVWLCFDEEDSIWRAVKLLTAHGSTSSDPENKCLPELQAFHLLSSFTPEKLRENHIASPVSNFTIQGPNGTHLGLVYPLLGCQLQHIFSYLAASEGLLKEITFQVVQAMDFLHREAKLCHGDFRPANIMYHLAEGVDKWPEEKMLQVLGQPETAKVVPLTEGDMETEEREELDLGPGVPKYIVGAARFDYYSGALAASVAVSDFGVSFEAVNPPSQTRISPRYCAPEDIVGIAPPGFTTDVWALMVTILEIITETGLVHYDSGIDVLRELECIAGPMPENYRDAWRSRGQEFANGDDDPSLPATVEMWQYEEMCKHDDDLEGKPDDDGADKETRPPNANVRLARMVMGEKPTSLTQEMWDEVRRQDFKATGLLPKVVRQEREPSSGRTRYARPKNVWHKMDGKEAELLMDLLSSVFKWQPGDRPLTGEVLKHPWFDDVRPQTSVFEDVSLKPEEKMLVDGEEAVNTQATLLGSAVGALQHAVQSWRGCV
ncbi:kinase-like domain-containing protein [Rhypophila decipiens]|uniref:non-specific serine/threonine protein kinase n=1 Tax=Rhypophila decipiens TaxID=261697 RepID=A0AAN6XWG5_9PEZI|nr:kinase-like domain-containing protein [Rhypophila decipiens]